MPALTLNASVEVIWSCVLAFGWNWKEIKSWKVPFIEIDAGWLVELALTVYNSIFKTRII